MKASGTSPTVSCVLVAYRSDRTVLRAVLDSICGQATQVLVVDDTEQVSTQLQVAPARYTSMSADI
jgi:hypothetical protein